MSNPGSDDEYSDAEQDQHGHIELNDDEREDDDAEEDGEEEEEQGDPNYVGSSLAETPQRRTRAPNVPLSTSSLPDFYSYGANMTDKQKREQDERNFAEAVEKERRSQDIADSNRRIRFDANGNLQYSEDPDSSGWRECSNSFQIVTISEMPVEPAVFHHWIRRELAEAANRRGSYGEPAFSTHSLS